MIPSGRHVGEGTHQRVPSPTFRVMTPTVVGKTGAAYLRLPQTTGSSPPWWGKLLGLWPVKVTVLMVAHPCLGWVV